MMKVSMGAMLLAAAIAYGAPAAAADPPAQGQGQGQGKGTTPAAQPAQPAAAAAAPAQPATNPTPRQISPAAYRAFAGECLVTPSGDNTQSALLASLLGIFAPKLAGAAIDAAGAALERAAADKQAEVTVALPLDSMPQCILVARGGSFDSAVVARQKESLRAALDASEVLLEVYLRPSTDGSAIALEPTWLIYRTALDGKGGHAQRKLAATVTFSTPGAPGSTSVTLPLGDYAPSTTPHLFEAVSHWDRSVKVKPVGSAASVWIATPFTAVAGPDDGQHKDDKQKGDPKDGQPAGGTQGASGQATTTVYGPGDRPQLIRIADPPKGLSTGKPPPPATVQQPGASAASSGGTSSGGGSNNPSPRSEPVQKRNIAINADIQPVSITVKLTELTPGNKVAKFLAPIVKAGKEPVVGLVDDAVNPTKQATAEAAAVTALNTAMDTYATATKDYWTKMAAYCAKDTDINSVRVKASDVYGAQVKLGRAAAAIEQKPPFDQLIDPATDNQAACVK